MDDAMWGMPPDEDEPLTVDDPAGFTPGYAPGYPPSPPAKKPFRMRNGFGNVKTFLGPNSREFYILGFAIVVWIGFLLMLFSWLWSPNIYAFNPTALHANESYRNLYDFVHNVAHLKVDVYPSVMVPEIGFSYWFQNCNLDAYSPSAISGWDTLIYRSDSVRITFAGTMAFWGGLVIYLFGVCVGDFTWRNGPNYPYKTKNGNNGIFGAVIRWTITWVAMITVTIYYLIFAVPEYNICTHAIPTDTTQMANVVGFWQTWWHGPTGTKVLETMFFLFLFVPLIALCVNIIWLSGRWNQLATSTGFGADGNPTGGDVLNHTRVGDVVADIHDRIRNRIHNHRHRDASPDAAAGQPPTPDAWGPPGGQPIPG